MILMRPERARIQCSTDHCRANSAQMRQSQPWPEPFPGKRIENLKLLPFARQRLPISAKADPWVSPKEQLTHHITRWYRSSSVVSAPRYKPRLDLNSDIDIKILFSKVDSPVKKQLWTYNKNNSRQKWRVFNENQL